MTITNPLALILLAAIPYIAYIGRPRLRYRRARDLTSIALRSVMILLLVLGLAGAQIVESSEKLAVVFLVDVSDSISPAMREAELDYVDESIQSMGPDDQFGVVLFGANAVVERSISPVRELETVRSTPVTSNTDFAEAIQLGLGMFPANTARRMVILTDGQVTVGDTEAQARLAAATGIEISYVAFTREPTPEIQVTDFRVPTTISEGQQFDLNLTVEASDATPATITILARGEIVHTEDVVLRAGANNYTLTLQSGSTGFKDFLVQVEPQGNDNFYQNNQLATFNTVTGPPRVLVVSDPSTAPPGDDEARYLVDALRGINLNVDEVNPGFIPTGMAALAQYDSIILVNVPATRLSVSRMEALEQYVKDLGGGLVVVGGPNAYGPGGYFETPLENALPVESRIKDQQRLPQLTIAYVIDRSGSMGLNEMGDIPKIELAKEAMIRSIDFLQPTDRAGLISFSTEGEWIAPFQPVYDKLMLQRLVATLRSGGGTDILAGMRLAAESIKEEPSNRKHIILLTDGGAAPEGLVELARDLYDNYDTTTSVIAIGSDSAGFLDDMAEAGHGHYHAVSNPESIPTIFTLETVLATRSYIVEEPFVPVLTANSPIMQGITSAPQLKGYVATSPKMAAQVILRGPEPYSDPLLATWQYGLGRVVAFTSDATSRWSSDWVQWSNFSRFWSQIIQWTITEGASNNLEARVEMENEQARLIVDARDENGGFLNALNLQVSLINPSESTGGIRIPLQQVAPGRYEATFTPTAEGAYFMRLNGSGIINGQTVEINQTTGWVMSYSPEYQALNSESSLDAGLFLDKIAGMTGGGSLNDTPDAVFEHNLEARNASAPLWPWLVAAAMLLLPLDIAVRRLIVTRSDLQRLIAFITIRHPVQVATSERVSSLMDARQRARQRIERHSAPESTVGALRNRRDQARGEQVARQTGQAAPVDEASDDKPRFKRPHPITTIESPKVDDEANIGARLLKSRKKQDREK